MAPRGTIILASGRIIYGQGRFCLYKPTPAAEVGISSALLNMSAGHGALG